MSKIEYAQRTDELTCIYCGQPVKLVHVIDHDYHGCCVCGASCDGHYGMGCVSDADFVVEWRAKGEVL